MRDQLPNALPLRWQTCNGSWKFDIEWTHGPLYSDSCSMCQQGVQMMMQAIMWLNDSALVDRSLIVDQNSESLTQRYSEEFLMLTGGKTTTRRWSTNDTKIVIVDFDPSPHKVFEWFLGRFSHQFALSHVHTVFLTDPEQDHKIVYEKVLDF